MDNGASSSHGGIEESSLHDESSHGFTLVDSRKLEYSNEHVPPPPSDSSVALEDETEAGQTILGSVDSNQQGTNTTTPSASTQAPLSIAPDELTLSDLADLAPPLLNEEKSPVPSEIITEQGDGGKLTDLSGDVEQAHHEAAKLQDSNAAASTQPNAKDDSSDGSYSIVRGAKAAPHQNNRTRGRRAVACFVLLAACSSLWAAYRYYSSAGPDLVATETTSAAIDVSGELVVVESGNQSQMASPASSNVSQDDVASNTLQPDIDEEMEDAEIGSGLGNEGSTIVIEGDGEGAQPPSSTLIHKSKSAQPGENTKLHFGMIGELGTIFNDQVLVDKALLFGNATTLPTAELKWQQVVAFGAVIVLAFTVCACGQNNKTQAEESSPKGLLTPQQVCWIIEHCDGFVSRKGRRSSLVSEEVDHPFDVAAYNCLTKEDLQKVCQHLGMDLNCITNRKKSWIVHKLVHRYVSILDGYTNAQIAQVLTAKGVDFSLKMERGELIKLAVEAAF